GASAGHAVTGHSDVATTGRVGIHSRPQSGIVHPGPPILVPYEKSAGLFARTAVASGSPAWTVAPGNIGSPSTNARRGHADSSSNQVASATGNTKSAPATTFRRSASARPCAAPARSSTVHESGAAPNWSPRLATYDSAGRTSSVIARVT